jgi:hypothetical protein
MGLDGYGRRLHPGKRPAVYDGKRHDVSDSRIQESGFRIQGITQQPMRLPTARKKHRQNNMQSPNGPEEIGFDL